MKLYQVVLAVFCCLIVGCERPANKQEGLAGKTEAIEAETQEYLK